jgi:hypothetical protein
VTVDGSNNRVDLAAGEGTMVKKGEPPLPPRKLLAPPRPVELKNIYNISPILTFAKIEGAKAFRVTISKDKAGKQVIREKRIKADESLKIPGLSDGQYFLLVQSIDDIGLEGPSSEAYLFTVRMNPLPPITQSPHGDTKIKGKTTEFQWLSVSDAVRYHLQVAEDTEFKALVADKADYKGTTFKTGSLDYKPYYFRISSIAKDDYQGAWSDPIRFVMSPLPPTPSVDQPIVSKDEINLKSRNMGEGLTYHFQIAKDVQFKQLIVDSKTAKPEITIKKPGNAGIYHVRTAVIDGDGDSGEFSAPQSFEVKERFPYEWVGGWLGIVTLIIILAH